jgi:dTDP-4-dehydrorhamnose 3,5-epimerase
MHFQRPPKAEAKLVRCIRGKIYDVIIDLRPGSPTYCQWVGVELGSGSKTRGSCFTADYRMVYIPEGFAHGFQTLQDDSEVFYQMFEFYAPEYASGVRWDDQAFGIKWPLPDPIMSERDRAFPPYIKC